MTYNIARRKTPTRRFAAVACGALLLTSACGSDDSGDAAESSTESTDAAAETSAEATADTGADAAVDTTAATAAEPETDTATVTETDTAATDTAATDTTATDASAVDVPAGCDDIAAQFVTRGSANADLDDPEVSATCDGDLVVVNSNGIPDYTYIETSPGQPTDRGHTFSFTSTPVVADETTAVPLLGTAAVSLGGIPIFGPTEGTGGDVESLPGILSDCGSHNGPSGFHIHLILTSSETDCLFTPEEVAAEPQLVGYAFDGFPIYTGNDQYTSSWELTDESLFATDTWAAHTYVEGSGDLDECNGLTDADGNYAYYTTDTFPYILGCYTGVVDLGDAGGGTPDDGGERPEPPEGGEERPEPPAEGEEAGVRPEPPEGGDRPERPQGAGAPPQDNAGA